MGDVRAEVECPRVGEGIDEIERVAEHLAALSTKVDLFVFPDVFEGACRKYSSDR